jgi:hypothetical protein
MRRVSCAEEEQTIIMLGLCSWAPNRTSACSKGVSPWGSAVRQRIMACPRCINARCVDVSPFLGGH